MLHIERLRETQKMGAQGEGDPTHKPGDLWSRMAMTSAARRSRGYACGGRQHRDAGCEGDENYHLAETKRAL